VKNRSVLEPLLADIFRTQTMQHWLDIFRAAGIPASPIVRLDEVVNSPQSYIRAMFPFIADSASGRLQIVGSPIKFSGSHARVLASAPMLGQHTNEALSEWLDVDDTELARLASAGAILQNAGDGEPSEP